MSSFTRYAAVAAVVLSLGFLVTALPVFRAEVSVPAITGTDVVSRVCAEAVAKLVVAINGLLGCETLVELQAHIKVCVALFLTCAEDLLKLGVEVEVNAEARASIVACFVALIQLVVRVCVQITVKFGLTAVLSLCVELGDALCACIGNLDVCVNGILGLCTEALINTDIAAQLRQLGLNKVISILGLTIAL